MCSANEAERVIQLYKNFTGDYIDTTCITEGQIFVDGKLILEVSKHDTISTIKTKIYGNLNTFFISYCYINY